jgi:hypothetical protein
VTGTRLLRLAGAVLVLVGGAVHLQLLVDGYGTDRIAVAFALNGAAAAIVGGYLVLRPDVLGALAGVALSVGSFVALVLARTGDGLLGFREQGLEPMPQLAVAVAAEALGAAVLVALALGNRRIGHPDTTGAP